VQEHSRSRAVAFRETARTQIVVFELDGYRYGLALADTRELLRMPSILPLPKAPSIVEGIVDVRGTVVPVLDFRKRFRLAGRSPHPSEHLIVAMAGSRTVALRVERVLGVEAVDDQDIAAAGAITPGADYVTGVAKLADGLVLIHDLRRFLAAAESEDLDTALAACAQGPS
jgi:purine-binding chemotaxis protein CheW